MYVFWLLSFYPWNGFPILYILRRDPLAEDGTWHDCMKQEDLIFIRSSDQLNWTHLWRGMQTPRDGSLLQPEDQVFIEPEI